MPTSWHIWFKNQYEHFEKLDNHQNEKLYKLNGKPIRKSWQTL